MQNLTIDTKQLDLLIKEFSASDKVVYLALRSALNRTAKWLRTQTTRDMRDSLKIKAALIRRRLKVARIKKTSNGWVINLWLGLNPIPMHDLNPKKTNTGVKAGKYAVEHAFLAKGTVFKRKGKNRLPIEKQFIDIQKQGENALKSSFIDEWQDIFFKEFERYMKAKTKL